MALDKITKNNQFLKQPFLRVYAGWFNYLIDFINTTFPLNGKMSIDTISEATAGAGVTVNGLKVTGGLVTASTVQEFTKEVTLTAVEIVGTAAGDIGHASGAILVAQPGAGYALEFIDAVLIYDYLTAAYTGGLDDLTIKIGSVAVSSAVSKANCVGAVGDKVFRIGSIDTEISLPVNTAISLNGTAYTQPGTAAGVLRCKVRYRVHTTGL